jgi:phenylalanyl-tRNA synthetase beta subunit
VILESCGSKPGPGNTVTRLPERKPVRMRIARAQKVIGMPIAADKMAGIFAPALPARSWKSASSAPQLPSNRET